MDFISHGLWSGIAAKALNQMAHARSSKNWASHKDSAGRASWRRPLFAVPRLSMGRMVFWGAFPDIFAFIPFFLWLLGNLLLGEVALSAMPRPSDMEPMPSGGAPIYRATAALYQFSHSLVLFLLSFLIAWLLFRRPLWEMGAWCLHIFLDIFTHSYNFYPTPFLWPVSLVKFNGVGWDHPWFLVLNYSAIALALLWLSRRKKSLPQTPFSQNFNSTDAGESSLSLIPKPVESSSPR